MKEKSVIQNENEYGNENEHVKLYPSGSAPARIYGTHKMREFSSSDLFLKLR